MNTLLVLLCLADPRLSWNLLCQADSWRLLGDKPVVSSQAPEDCVSGNCPVSPAVVEPQRTTSQPRSVGLLRTLFRIRR
jgi:hypothetical protein